jgi:hypothetical protein
VLLVLDHYENFFIASSGASAAILGLLFVAVTVANTSPPGAIQSSLVSP